MASSSVISCRWDWCRSSFPNIDALEIHVKHEHIWPMKPMQKDEITLMRRMDIQSLHSSQCTDSFIISKGVVAAISRSKKPPSVPPCAIPKSTNHPRGEELDMFASLSPPQTHSPEKLPMSPTFGGLARQSVPSGPSTAVEMFEQLHHHKESRRPPLSSRQCSPTQHPLSPSSGSSQDVVERQLTQEEDIGTQGLLLPGLQVDDDLADAELRWPTDDELDMYVEKISSPEQTVSSSGSSSDSARGQNFRHGSLNVPLPMISISANIPVDSQAPRGSQESYAPSQPFVLQTQASYSSPAEWSQT